MSSGLIWVVRSAPTDAFVSILVTAGGNGCPHSMHSVALSGLGAAHIGHVFVGASPGGPSRHSPLTNGRSIGPCLVRLPPKQRTSASCLPGCSRRTRPTASIHRPVDL